MFKDNFFVFLGLVIPIIIAYIFWIDWMEPISYWQKCVSFVGSVVTVIGLIWIESQVFK